MSGNKSRKYHDDPPTYDDVMGASVSSSFGLHRPFPWPSAPIDSLLPLPRSASSSRGGSPANSRPASRTPSPDRSGRQLYSPNSIIPAENNNVRYDKTNLNEFFDLPPTYDEAVGGNTLATAPSPIPPPHQVETSDSYETRKMYSPNHLIPNTNGNVRYDDETPTVSALDDQFNSAEDALALFSALEEDLDATDIIKLVCTRSNEQRVQIKKHYIVQLGGTGLKLDEDDFDFRKVLVAVFQPLASYYCDEFHHALNSFDVDYIFQIICILSNDELKTFVPTFENKFEISLQQNMKDGQLSKISDIVLSILEAKRDESHHIDENLMISDMKLLVNHSTIKFHKRDEIREIFVRRSFRYLHELFRRYEEQTERSIERIIKDEVPICLERFYLTVVRYAMSPTQFFAKILCNCLNFKMDKNLLNRIIITRCEIDLAAIKKEYYKQYHETLRHGIKKATSGTYKHILYGLIREKRSSEI